MSYQKKTICSALAAGLVLALSVGVVADDQKPVKERGKKKEATSFSVLDSTEDQWGRRSINDSVYRGYTVNAVYFERGRQRLPDSFNMYRPQPINVESSGGESPTTIKVNGKDQKLPSDAD